MKLLAFDLEIAKVFEDDQDDWKQHRPFGISCAATFSTVCESPRVWHGQIIDGQHAPQMSRAECADLVRFLISKASEGFAIVTWNGLSFDFDVLAEESGLHSECCELARNHIDMMFHVLCDKGHRLGLDKVAKGFGLPGKTEGMSGSLAPKLWATGECEKVLEYVGQDVRTTLAVVMAGNNQRVARWLSGKGKIQECRLPSGWLTVTEALRLPEPDTSWMIDPPTRTASMAWMESGS